MENISTEINLDLISSGTAMLLKEKGCNVVCDHVYVINWDLEGLDKDSNLYKKVMENPTIGRGVHKFSNHPDHPNYMARLEHWQVIKWLRLKHDIHIFSSCTYGVNSKGEDAMIFFAEIRQSVKDAPMKRITLQDEEFASTFNPIGLAASKIFDTPEDAIEAAIKYTLEKLI